MSDQKKPPVPSFEDLQKAAQPDPRLAKTTPHAPNPLLIDQTRTSSTPLGPTTPGSRLDPAMLQRLAQSGLAGDPRYGSGPNQQPRTELGPAPRPPTGDERTQMTRPPNAPAAPAAPRPPNPPLAPTPAVNRPVAGPPSAYVANAPMRPASIPPAPAAKPPAGPSSGALPNATRAPAAPPLGPPGPAAPPSNAPRAPSAAPSIATSVPRAPVPAGQPGPPLTGGPTRAPSIPAAPASLAPPKPPPPGPPPKMPAPPPPTSQPVMRAAPLQPLPVKPPVAAPALANAPLRSNAPPPPQHSPSIAKTSPLTAAVPKPLTDDPLAPTSIRAAPHEPMPATQVTKSGPPMRAHVPDDSMAATTIKPAPQPPASRVAIEPDDPLALAPTAMRQVPEPPTTSQRAPASRPAAPPPATTNATQQMSRSELAHQFDDTESPTTPRLPVAGPPTRSPQPKLPPQSDERTPVQVPAPEVTTDPQPMAFAAAESSTPLPHLERPPSLNSKSLLDVSPVVMPPAGRSPTVNLRQPQVPDAQATPPQPPPARPVPMAERPAPPPALLDITPDERTPVKLGAAFAVTQPGVPGPFGGKRPLATGPLPKEPELAPVTDAGVLEPVTSDDHGPALRSSLGEAFDPEARSDVQRIPEAESKQQLVAAPASLWRRCLSFTVDFALVGSLCAGLLYAATLVKGVKAVPAHLAPLDHLLFRMHALDKLLLPALGACALVVVAYAAVFAMALGGRTPGRLLSGVRLVTDDGQPPGPGRALLRAMLGLLSFGLFLSGFWLALFDRKGQTLHDKLTRTFIVKPL